jgi:hypothetical protein
MRATMHLSGQKSSGVAPMLVKRGLASREAEPVTTDAAKLSKVCLLKPEKKKIAIILDKPIEAD